MTTTESNKLIAEFMGLTPNKHDGGNTFCEKMFTDKNGEQWCKKWFWPDYDKNWNSLMLVVDKINTIEKEEFGVTIRGNITDIESCYATYDMYIEETKGNCFENTYKCVVRFIQWHNQSKQQLNNDHIVDVNKMVK